MKLVECVPNFSEGRSERVLDALGATLGSHARLLKRCQIVQCLRILRLLGSRGICVCQFWPLKEELNCELGVVYLELYALNQNTSILI